ncbi:hypothetical protein [Natronogracilivirga saccharolytica]|nr:hypothetical protein [Natronogracilivirga saccharolytica]
MDDYQDHISTNSRPDLGFDGIDALSVKRLVIPDKLTPHSGAK